MEQLLAALRAAGEPTRLRLLALCAHMDLTVSQLTQILGQSQPRVSRHLKLLLEAGLLDRLREGSWSFYRLAAQAPGAELGRTLIDSIPADDPILALDLERLQTIRRAREKQAAAYFQQNAAEWDRVRSLQVDEAEVERSLLELVPDRAVEDLLDIGTGTGRMLEILGQRVRRAVGIDLSHEMLTVARSNLERAQLRNCLVRHGDMYRLPVQSGSFDAVTVHQVLHYAEDPAAVIAEAARVLRPEGRLIVVDFAKHELDYLRDEHAHRRLGFRDDEVSGWCKTAGLETRPPVFLPGDPLTVCIWVAARPLAAPLAPAA